MTNKFMMNLKEVNVKPEYFDGMQVINLVFETGLKNDNLLTCGYCGTTSAISIKGLLSKNPIQEVVCSHCLGSYDRKQIEEVYGKEVFNTQIFALELPENTTFLRLNGLGLNDGIQPLRKHLFNISDKAKISFEDVEDVELELSLTNGSKLKHVLNGIGFYCSIAGQKQEIKAEGKLPELELTAVELEKKLAKISIQ